MIEEDFIIVWRGMMTSLMVLLTPYRPETHAAAVINFVSMLWSLWPSNGREEKLLRTADI
jgi:hypothetical protein